MADRKMRAPRPANADREPSEQAPDTGAKTAPGADRQKPRDQKEIGGPKGPEPTRYGDWEKGGRCFDF